MSRMERRDYLLTKSPRPRKFTKREMAAKLFREIKRRLIADGKVTDPASAPPKYRYHWGLGMNSSVGGIVEANTAGEARSIIKSALNLRPKDRLPKVVVMVREAMNAT